MTQASSSYKTYNRQPRTLTEESGFAGGMYWTNNNVDATHLKAIVNFDYDDTTGFLKTRQPLGYDTLYDYSYNILGSATGYSINPPALDTPLRLLDKMSTTFIGAYSLSAHTQPVNTTTLHYSRALDSLIDSLATETTIPEERLGDLMCCATLMKKLYEAFGLTIPEALNKITDAATVSQASSILNSIDFPDLYTTVGDTGTLYVFGDVVQNNHTNIQTCGRLQAIYKTLQGDYYTVDCSEVNLLLDQKALWQTGVLHFEVADDTLYCTTASGSRAFYAFKLLSFVSDNTAKIPYTFKLSPQPYSEKKYRHWQRLSVFQYPWQTYKYLVNQTTLLEASVSGFNAGRGNDIYTYASNKTRDVTSPLILGCWFTSPDAGNAVITTPRIGQRVRVHIAINGYDDNSCCLISKTNVPTPKHGVYVFKKIASSVDDKYDAVCINDEDFSSATSETYGKAIPYYYNSDAKAVVFDYTFTGDTNIFEIVISLTGESDYESEHAIARQIINVSFSSATSTTKVKPYKMFATKAHCSWNNHYCLWGADAHPNTLFLSYKDNYYYYPVPHNVLLFDSTIVNCVPYLDSLLVFTTNKLYQITETPEGTLVQSVVQNELPVDKADASYLQVIKNMVLFKSGRYFYMVVPKSQSLKGELTVAPIYKNIAGFLDNMAQSVAELLTALYPERKVDVNSSHYQISQHPIKIYAEQDTVYILYSVITTDNQYILFLNYNTNLRAWTLYLEDNTNRIIHPTLLAPSREMLFIQMNPNDTLTNRVTVSCDKSRGTKEPPYNVVYITQETQHYLLPYVNQKITLAWTQGQVLINTTGIVRYNVSAAESDGTVSLAAYIELNTPIEDELPDTLDLLDEIGPVLNISNKQNNNNTNNFRCLLDTGYRTLANSLKKRFRELQLKVYCHSEKVTKFGSAFYVDGVIRRNYVSLKENILDDQTVTLLPDYDCNTFITEPTMGLDVFGQPVHLSDVVQKEQGSDCIVLDDWSLDFSHFKREAPTTVRIPVSGKGYTPRFILMSPSTSALQVNSINWVYRIMNAR